MYTITKRQSEHQNEWDLFINDSCIGSVEVVFLTNTSRTCIGSVAAMTTDGQYIEYSYDGESARKIMSIAQFISNAKEAFGEHELKLSEKEETPAVREFDNIVLISEVTDENAERLAIHLGVNVNGNSNAEKAEHIREYLRAERDKMLAMPMYELVRRSKFKEVLVTPDRL